jgi:DnaJ-domain-containing protein 1
MSSEIADPYSVLGISRTATADDLKRAYRRLSKAWHPDQHAGESEAQRSEADRRFKLINAAYVAVGEILRDTLQAQTAAAQDAINQRSDARVNAIRSVVASAALRVIPNVPRYIYRRIVGVVEAILLDTIAVGDGAFALGFEVAVNEALAFAGLGSSERNDMLRVLDAAADDLQWRGKGMDPASWQTLLRPLEHAMHPQPAAAPPATRKATGAHARRPALLAVQIGLALLFIVCLLPVAPIGVLLRVVLLAASLAAEGYVTYIAFGP